MGEIYWKNPSSIREASISSRWEEIETRTWQTAVGHSHVFGRFGWDWFCLTMPDPGILNLSYHLDVLFQLLFCHRFPSWWTQNQTTMAGKTTGERASTTTRPGTLSKATSLRMKEAYAFLEGAHIRDGHIPDCAQFKVLTQEANMWGTFF